MPPQTQTPSSTGNALDPQAVALAKAIRQTESGGNPTARGKSGEYGAYQYTNNTWLKNAAEAGVTTPLEQASLEDQNKVAYHTIKKWKDAGYNPGQIASMWNAGEGEPDAYTGKFSNGKPSIGTNSYGVKFDVPAYAKSVASAYQTLKQGGEVNADPNNPSSTANQTPTESPQPQRGFVSNLIHGIVEPVATTLARPIQAGAELLGASEADVNKATKDIAGDYVAPVPHSFSDVPKDIGRAAETVALGMPVGSITKSALMGTVAGAGAGLEQGDNTNDVLKQAALGAGVGAAGGAVAKLLSAAPKWLAKQAFGNLNPEEIQQVLNTKSAGTASGLLNQSKKAVADYGSQIDKLLQEAPDNGAGNFAVRATETQFPEYAGNETAMLTKIKRLIPSGYDVGLKGNGWDRATIISYIDKIANGTATLWEKNRVRSAIDAATSGGYAKLARAINPSAGQDLAMTFASALRNEVQQSVPKTAPIFDDFAKEMAIQKAIKTLTKGSGKGLIRWSDIVPFMLGNAAGPLGGVGAVAVNRAANSPITAFNAAKLLQGTGKVLNPALSRAGLVSTVK